MLADSARTIRVGAANVLRQLADIAAANTRALGAPLQDRDPAVRPAAAVALGFVMLPNEARATTALARARSDADAAVRPEASHALTGSRQRGGQDPPPHPSRADMCQSAPRRTPGCCWGLECHRPDAVAPMRTTLWRAVAA